MQNSEEPERKTNEYFSAIAKRSNYNKSLDEALKDAQHHVEQNIEGGKIKMDNEGDNHKKEEFLNNLLKRKDIDPFESRYKGFLLNSDREKSHERYEIFKKIKQEYSKQKTAIVVKNVQDKIKEWTNKKLQIDRRLERSNQRKKRIQRQIQQQNKLKEQEKKQQEAQQKKQELKKRLQLLDKRRWEREERIKESQVRSKEVKAPKYKEIEMKFKQIQERMQKQRERILEEKKHGLIIKKEEIKQHAKKYESLRKQKQEQRKKKYKVDEEHNSINQGKDFDTFIHNHSIEKQEEEKKRKRRKQFQQKVRSMSILPKKGNDDDSVEKSVTKSPPKSRVKDKEEKEQSIDGSIKKKKSKHELNATADPRKLGNEYLRSLRGQDKSSLGKSLSLPKINKQVMSRPVYKNYLTEAKIHLKKKTINDEIDELKQNCRSKSQIYDKLSKKSQGYESNMIKKIMELSRINKYDDSVKKQSQIDELHAKYIKMRLACID